MLTYSRLRRVGSGVFWYCRFNHAGCQSKLMPGWVRHVLVFSFFFFSPPSVYLYFASPLATSLNNKSLPFSKAYILPAKSCRGVTHLKTYFIFPQRPPPTHTQSPPSSAVNRIRPYDNQINYTSAPLSWPAWKIAWLALTEGKWWWSIPTPWARCSFL